MFVHDSCKMSPGAGSGACPRCALAVGRAGGDGSGGISALRDQEGCGVPGTGLPLCRRGPWPPESPLCPGTSLMSCPGEERAGSGRRRRGKGLGFPRLISEPSSPHPWPWGSLPGAGSSVLRERMLQGRVQLAPLPRSGGDPGGAVSVPTVPPGSFSSHPCRHQGVLGARRNELILLEGAQIKLWEKNCPPRNSLGASESWCSPTVRPYRGALKG